MRLTDQALSQSHFMDRAIPLARQLRKVEVREINQLTPHMKRVTVGGNALKDFRVSRPAQWVKVFPPAPIGSKLVGRAYTIRNFYERDAELDIDFVMHGDGPCSSWAQHAKIGEILQIAGPRGGFRLDPTTSHLLIGGDETELPAIGSILEALPAGITAAAFIEIPDEADQQVFQTQADVSLTWMPRSGVPAGDSEALQTALMSSSPALSGSEVWVAAEVAAVKGVRQHFQVIGGAPRNRITSSGYWKKGETDFRDGEGDQ